MKLKINVTQEDIDNSTCSTRGCPIALAAGRALKALFGAHCLVDFSPYSSHAFVVTSTTYYTTKLARLDQNHPAVKFAMAFDEWYGLKAVSTRNTEAPTPGEFEIDLGFELEDLKQPMVLA
jgi:hypothetical protein